MSSLEPIKPFPYTELKDRLENIKYCIKRSAEKSHRPAEAIKLLAVTKGVAVERIADIVSLGVLDLGENKIQEAVEKQSYYQLFADTVQGDGITHHFLGHLQTNKARKAVELFDLIQSVNRPSLAAFLNRVAGECGKKQRCLIEVNVGSEPSKTGIPLSEAAAFIEGFGQYKNLLLEGLMMIAPFGLQEDQTRACMRRFYEFFMAHQKQFGKAPVLSMGMSDDFQIAVQEGSTMVRVGRALFGERLDSKIKED